MEVSYRNLSSVLAHLQLASSNHLKQVIHIWKVSDCSQTELESPHSRSHRLLFATFSRPRIFRRLLLIYSFQSRFAFHPLSATLAVTERLFSSGDHELWPDIQLWTWSRLCQRKPACRISRSKVIHFKSVLSGHAQAWLTALAGGRQQENQSHEWFTYYQIVPDHAVWEWFLRAVSRSVTHVANPLQSRDVRQQQPQQLLEEASTHESAMIHVGNVFLYLWPLAPK